MIGQIIGWLFWIAAGYTGFTLITKWNEHAKLVIKDWIWISICVAILTIGLIYRFSS